MVIYVDILSPPPDVEPLKVIAAKLINILYHSMPGMVLWALHTYLLNPHQHMSRYTLSISFYGEEN